MPSWSNGFASVYLRHFARRALTPDSEIIAERAKADQAAEKHRFRGSAEIVPVTLDAAGRQVAAGGSLSAEWIRPKKADSHRVILYFHGGGFCLGSRATHRTVAVKLCESADARGLSVDYRLAPEHPFPAALDDAVSAYRWLLAQGISPESLVMAGDGAGGGLALSTAMALRDGGAPLPCALVLLSPWTDLAMTGWSLLTNGDKDIAQKLQTLAVSSRHYLKKTLPTHPFASPYFGRFDGLPPMMIQAGSEEILRDDATRVAEKAEAAGVDVNCEIWEGMSHLFQLHGRNSESKGAIARLGAFIRARTPPPKHVAVPRKSARALVMPDKTSEPAPLAQAARATTRNGLFGGAHVTPPPLAETPPAERPTGLRGKPVWNASDARSTAGPDRPGGFPGRPISRAAE